MRITENFKDPRTQETKRVTVTFVAGEPAWIGLTVMEIPVLWLTSDQLGTLIGMLQALQRRAEGK
jgi:hypothetical protein